MSGASVLCMGGRHAQPDVADWQWVLGLDLWGVIHGIRSFVPRMLAQDTECHIVNTGSAAGLVVLPTTAAYTVAKHGVVVLSETLRDELQDRGAKIRVSVLCPGGVQTRIGESERNRLPEFQRSTEDAAGTARHGMARQGICRGPSSPGEEHPPE